MIRKRRKPRPGRLAGAALEALRQACFERDGGKCVKCGRTLLYWHEWMMHPDRYHMSHKRNKRMFGDDLNNVEALCSGDHMIGKHNPKSVPAKVAA